MIARILLVARREYRQVAMTRGFWMLLMVVPLAIAVSVIAALFMSPPRTVAFMIVDPSGAVAAAVDRRIDIAHQQEVMVARSSYEARWRAGPDKRLKPGAPPFVAPQPRFIRIAPPTDVPLDRGLGRFGAAAQAHMQGDVSTPLGPRPLSLAVWIPADFGVEDEAAAMWSNRPVDGELTDLVRSELARALRLSALRAAGVSDATARRIDALAPAVSMVQTSAGKGHDTVVLRSVLPLAMVYLLMIASMTTGSMMLQGVIEERSNKLLESVLACVAPGELMQGKLLGLGGVGLTIVAVWVGCAVAAALATHGVVADLLRPSLQSMSQPWMAPALIFYFVTGYLIISAVFLAVGSMCDSMQDAQGYMMPVLMVITMPVVLMIDVAVLNPDAPAARVMTWIPIYTPFAMLARLGGGVSLVEVLGSGALLVAFIWLELAVLGRIFRASVLATGQRPLRSLVRMVLARSPAS